MRIHRLLRALVFGTVIGAVLVSGVFVGSAQIGGASPVSAPITTTAIAAPAGPSVRPAEIDVRGPHGIPKGTFLITAN